MIEKDVWLWLDKREGNSQHNTARGVLEDEGYELMEFSSSTSLADFLIKKKGSLRDYGLIINPNLKGESTIVSPKAWNGKEDITLDTVLSHTAGFAYYNLLILEADTWRPTPPVIFLAYSLDKRIKNGAEKIKENWQKINGNKRKAEVYLKIPADFLRYSLPGVPYSNKKLN